MDNHSPFLRMKNWRNLRFRYGKHWIPCCTVLRSRPARMRTLQPEKNIALCIKALRAGSRTSMTNDQEERLVLAFEQIAIALTGIDGTQQRQFAKQWPKRKKVREAVVTRIPSEEDRIREQHGSGTQPIEQWYSDLCEEDEAGNETIGPREREFRRRQAAGTQTACENLPAGSGAETPEGEA